MSIRDPWTATGLHTEAVLRELQKELAEGHPLFGKQVEPIAMRKDRDDVLLKVGDEPVNYAVVHLTWSGKKGRTPIWPITKLFASWGEWVKYEDGSG
jgi:hypothetical protein